MPNWQYILILLALLVLLSYPIWRRFVLAKVHRVGEDAGQKLVAKRLPGLLDALSTTLELQADPATAEEVINAAVAAKPKKATSAGPGLWNVTFTERDDVQTRLTQTDGGVRLAVVKAIEFMDYPQGGQDWEAFRGRIVEAAQARGVATREGTSPHLQRVLDPKGGETLRGNPKCIWVAPEA